MIRRISSIVIACLIGFIVEYYFSMTHIYLVPLTAVLVMLTPMGNFIYHSMIRLIVVVLLVIVLSVFIQPHQFAYMRLYDVCLGGAIGVFANLFIFPRRIDKEFRAAILPILNAYECYFMSIIQFLFEKNEKVIETRKITVERQLEALPVWVYERGFDVGLKKGHQYFLMKITHIAEILFAMHHVVRSVHDDELLEPMREPVFLCADRIEKFFKALVTVFELKKLTEGIEDFEAELVELDQKFQAMMPVNLELLDISREDVSFYGFIYTLVDLRKALIRLSQALR